LILLEGGDLVCKGLVDEIASKADLRAIFSHGL
jgi:hypothetical protein